MVQAKDQKQTMEISGYEQFREERIKENLERMQKLGILDLSLKFKSIKPPTSTRRSLSNKKTHHHAPSISSPSGPVRRSSRLQNTTPVSYCEVRLKSKDNSLDDNGPLIEEGSKPEVYTEEHEKLLGSTENGWTLFVDGYGKDGKRIYDPVRGKTCHQCRQKTLGHRTHCSECNMVQGQFCGDCLYMRYGENVLEANENPNWICPVCRGICNCSLCRQAKGWPPTGTLYRKISSLGYKSVAHYLIQTRRANTESDKNDDLKVPTSAKRSLPFSDTVATPGDDDISKSNSEILKTDLSQEVNTTSHGHNVILMEEICPKKEICHSKLAPESEVDHLLESTVGTQSNNLVEYAVTPEVENPHSLGNKEKDTNFLEDFILTESSKHHLCSSISQCLGGVDDSEIKKEETTIIQEDEVFDSEIKKEQTTVIQDDKLFVPPGKSSEINKEHTISVPTPGSIAGRLRQRQQNKCNANEEAGLINGNYSAKDIVMPDSTAGRSRQKRNKNIDEEQRPINGNHSLSNAKDNINIITPDADSIARRLKMRRRA